MASKKSSSGLLLVAPTLLIVLIFGIYPVIVLIATSFGLGEVGAYENPGPTLQYYGEFVGSERLTKSIINSLIIGLGSVIITLVASIPTVLYLAKKARTGTSTKYTDALITFPITLPGIIIGFFAIVLTGRTGLLGEVIPFLKGAAFGYLGLMIAYIYFSIPRIVSPLRGAADLIDPELEDTAHSLGASKARVFFTVTLPLILPAAIEVSGTAAAVALGGYGTVAALSEGIRLLPLDVVDALNNGYYIATSSAFAVVLALLAIGALAAGKLCAHLVERKMG
ncbi:ABC transporter permease [Corynebacterium uterequi]|uniref:ABC-type spermidine/putrescine transport system, permease component II n=1 Tax=Corynebacterium uterequi TaxID=1072256 RepID=A0A0G3HD56_9CORY|nr:ABC transporter permease subunit [Corynebacterium uterequi]AKK11224.1 ABC-type spermidine/putrescine transport system, permease component II [Corynebacterium uterequi]